MNSEHKKFIRSVFLFFAFLNLPVFATDPVVIPPVSMPIFELPDLQGKIHISADLQGKIVVMDFWATWCITCREAFPFLNAIQKKYDFEKVVVLGVNLDEGGKRKIKKFVKKFSLEYQILWDRESSLAENLQVESIPSVFVFDVNGKLVLALRDYGKEQESVLAETVEKLLGN